MYGILIFPNYEPRDEHQSHTTLTNYGLCVSCDRILWYFCA